MVPRAVLKVMAVPVLGTGKVDYPPVAALAAAGAVAESSIEAAAVVAGAAEGGSDSGY